MLIDEIRGRMKEAMKAKRSVEKEILRVAIGEVTTEQARAPEPLDDAAVEKILRKLIKSNRESLDTVQDDDRRAVLEEEVAVLESLLPKTLTVDEIAEALTEVASDLEAANNDGQATGIAMKHLRAKNLSVEGKDVAAAVQKLRS